ncbi:drug/metabolite transporter (DMT)-like permease [Hypnocyclicus thermotrophus]|uniref:Drug/metabolite transporter (DMT)-like permease n=1 Tax=Hypnocyclicus thermotrophus TaxID=1627895 RepID=A0AA46I4T2_9FUSO|nr:DMT family transporter [Hypnocyclicus thermotrophus]TDT67846.1 drug/metabolite transporter (DMT)-like permease [Hypnocyclicus thermotrophus]
MQYIWHFNALLVIFFWSSTFFPNKILLANGFTSSQILIIRSFIAFISLFLFYPKRIKIDKSQFKLVFLAGLFGISSYFFFEISSLKYTSPGNSTLILSTIPILNAIIVHIINKKKFEKNLLIGSIFSLIGLFFVIFNGRILQLNPLGDFLAFLAAFSWSIYTIILEKFNKNITPIIITRYVFLSGILTSLPLMFLIGDFSLNFNINISTISSLLFLGLITSAICFLLWNRVVNHLGILTSSLYIYLLPIFAMILSKIIYGYPITLLMIIGTIFTLGGVFIASRKRNKIFKSIQQN